MPKGKTDSAQWATATIPGDTSDRTLAGSRSPSPSPDSQFEIREALALQKPIVLLHEVRAVLHALTEAAPTGAAAVRFIGLLQAKLAELGDFEPLAEQTLQTLL